MVHSIVLIDRPSQKAVTSRQSFLTSTTCDSLPGDSVYPTMGEALIDDRADMSRRGRGLEYFTIAWNVMEGLVAVIAGMVAGSISLVGFGIDSFVEVTSGAALLWRLSVDADAERRERNE